MTSEYIQQYAKRRMKAMGFEAFDLEMRTFNLPAGIPIPIKAWNFWIYLAQDLIAPASLLQVDSNFGVFDSDLGHFSQQHEHTGIVTFLNKGTNPLSLSFYAAIPK